MFPLHRRKPPQPLSLVLLSSAIACVGLCSTPARAHQVELGEDVAATIHIEPNDTPRAGESSLTWFALTRPGGEVIPLEDCQCQLAVYAQPVTPTSTPLLSPPLQPVSAEGYSQIPSADIVFPAVGAYTLVLTGNPTQPEEFQPFELTFEVTVATAAPNTSAPSAGEDRPEASSESSESGEPQESEATATPDPSEPAGDPNASAHPKRPWYWLSLPMAIALAAFMFSLRRDRPPQP